MALTIDESQRILAEYDRRDRDLPADYYALFQAYNLFVHQEHVRRARQCLERAGQLPPGGRRLLEVGCGIGEWLSAFELLGFGRHRLAGIELGAARARAAAERLPGADVRSGDAANLPWEDQSFEVCFQRMMFSSILDPDVRRFAAAEMIRVTRATGAILWIDFFLNPGNKQAVGMSRSEIARLFPGWQATLYRCTLAPPLARRLVKWSWNLARGLEQLKILNTFYIGCLRRCT